MDYLLKFCIRGLIMSFFSSQIWSLSFDFVSNYKIVKTKIREQSNGRLKLDIESLAEVVLFTVILIEMSGNSTIFMPQFKMKIINSTGEYIMNDKLINYQGYIESQPYASHVSGTLYLGSAFEGTIKSLEATLYFEAVDRHSKWPITQSFMYRDDDVSHIIEKLGSFRQMDHVDDDTDENSTSFVQMVQENYSPYVFASNVTTHNRRRRDSMEEKQIRYCDLHIVIDGYFTHYMANNNKLEAAKLIVQYIQNAHGMFISQDFDGDTQPDNIGFVLSAMTFIDKIAGYNYLKADKKPEQFLELFTNNYQFPGICSAVVFTFQDFGSTLGMAWVAKSTKPPRTGIGSPKNHGFVTCLLSGKRLSAKSNELTLVHELGHSFGSSHDPKDIGQLCSPTDPQGGRYVMYPTVSQGNMPNNFHFSPCSKNVINVILNVRSDDVFTKYRAPYCGNGFVEVGEECDCGTPLSCKAIDQCCHPAGHSNQCQLRRDVGARCSAATDACCTFGCQVVKASENKVCGGTDECLDISRCDGAKSTCPVAKMKPDGYICSKGTKTCLEGKCVKSVCHVAGLEECQCSALENACKFCCSNTTHCEPAANLVELKGINIATFLEPGSLCMNYTGYCSENNICMKAGLDYVSVLGYTVLNHELKTWFDKSWSLVMIIIMTSTSLFLVFFCTRPGTARDVTHAFRTGNVSRVIEECKRHQRLLNEKIDRLNTDFELNARGQLLAATALARLIYMFPLTPVNDLYMMMTKCADECEVVKRLILLKQPLRSESMKLKLTPEFIQPKSTGRSNEQYAEEIHVHRHHHTHPASSQTRRKMSRIAISKSVLSRTGENTRKRKLLHAVVKLLKKEDS